MIVRTRTALLQVLPLLVNLHPCWGQRFLLVLCSEPSLQGELLEKSLCLHQPSLANWLRRLQEIGFL